MPSFIIPTSYCCFDGSRKFLVQNTNNTFKGIKVYCGDGFNRRVTTLLLPPSSTYVFCCSGYYPLPSRVTMFPLGAAAGSCIPNTPYAGSNVIVIGNQLWMTKNLDVTTFRNGDPIPYIADHTAWATANYPAFTYPSDLVNGTSPDPGNNARFGKLYNFYAVKDPRGLAPRGWKIPTLSDYHTLFTRVNPDSFNQSCDYPADFVHLNGTHRYRTYFNLARKLKSNQYFLDWHSTTEPAVPNGGYNTGWYSNSNLSKNSNSTGFTAVGAGWRFGPQKFINKSGYYTTESTYIPGENNTNYSYLKWWGVYWAIDDLTPASPSLWPYPDSAYSGTLATSVIFRTMVGRENIVYNQAGACAMYDDDIIVKYAIKENIYNVDGPYAGGEFNAAFENWNLGYSVRCIYDCGQEIFPYLQNYTPYTGTADDTPCEMQSSQICVPNDGFPIDVFYIDNQNVRHQVSVEPGECAYICYCDIIGVYIQDLGNQGIHTPTNYYTLSPRIDCTTTSTTTTTTIPAPCCRIVLPLPNGADQDMSIGTTIVHPEYTGPTLPDYSVYVGANCTYEDMPPLAAVLGYTPGTFTYSLSFSEPTTQAVLLVYGGGGIVLSGGGPATFVFGTNGANTSISFCTAYHCYAQTERVDLVSRPTILKIGRRRPIGLRSIPGAAFVFVEADTPFTELTISGDGKGGGASFAICNKLWPVTTTTTTTIVPGPCTLTLGTFTNNSDVDTTATYFPDETPYFLTSVNIPANSSVEVCLHRVVYHPPTVTYTTSGVACCSTTTTSTTSTTTTTTVPPPCNTYQAYYNETVGSSNLVYIDCNGVMQTVTMGGGNPSLPTAIQFCAIQLISSGPLIFTSQIASNQCSTTTSTTSTSTTTTTTTIAPPCSTYQAVFIGLNGSSNNFVYYDCNGVLQTGTVGIGINSIPQVIQFCSIQLVSTSSDISITQIASNQCSTTTTTTSTTTTTIAPCDAYTVVQTSYTNDFTPLFSYINCNGVLSYLGGFAPSSVNIPITFCAQSIVNVPSIYQVTLLHNGCTTTTTTCAPIGDCQRQCIEDTLYLYNGFTIPGQSPITFTNYIEACNGLDFIVNHNNTGLQLSVEMGYGGNDHYADPIYAYPNTASAPELCELIADGWYIWATMSGNIYIQGTSFIVNIVNGVFQNVQGSCGNCVPYSVPVEKECNYQLIERGVPQADFTSSITSACAAVDTVIQWPLFNDPMELQILSETAKAYSWEIGYSVYKTTSVNNPPCLDRWIKNGYFVTNWNTGEVTEIRNGGIISITNCAGFTTTTTTTCAALPTNEIILMNTISYDGGVTFQSFTDSEAHACSSRVNYLNAFASQNILVNLASTSFLGDSIAVGVQLYDINATNCTQVSNTTGYFLTTDTLTNNVIVYVLNGVITAITVCIPTTTTTTCLPIPTNELVIYADLENAVTGNSYNNVGGPLANSFALLCHSLYMYNNPSEATEPYATDGLVFDLQNDPTYVYGVYQGSLAVDTQLFLSPNNSTICRVPKTDTGWGVGLDLSTVYHIEDGIITEITDCNSCTRPSGLTAFQLMDSYYIGSDAPASFKESRATACAAVADCVANPGNYTMTGFDIYTTALEIGNLVYADTGSDCQLASDGFYIYNFNGTTFNKMVQIVCGKIFRIWTNCLTPLAPGPISELQIANTCNDRVFEYSIDTETMPTGAVDLIWNITCNTCTYEPSIEADPSSKFKVKVYYPNSVIDATVSVTSIDVDGDLSGPTTYGVELNSCCFSYPNNAFLANNIYADGDVPENGQIFSQDKNHACEALNQYILGDGELLLSGIDTKSINGIEVDSIILDEVTCETIPDGWYIYEALPNRYIANVVDGVIVELVDNNVDPVPDQPTLSGNVDIIANDVCGSKSIRFTMVNLPNGATDLDWQSPSGTLVDSGIDENDNYFAEFTYDDSVTFAPTRVYGIREGSCPGPYLQILYTFSSCS